jgi:hypothetical protein
MNRKMTFGVVVGTRAFFNPELARAGRTQILGKLQALGFDAVVLPPDAMPTGVVETIDDARKCAALFRGNGTGVLYHARDRDVVGDLPIRADSRHLGGAIRDFLRGEHDLGEIHGNHGKWDCFYNR